MELSMSNLNGKFIHGPVWCEWLSQAAKLGPSVGLIGAILWFYDGIYKGYEFKVDSKLGDITKLSRQTLSKGLKKLAASDLITLAYAPGSYPTVKICKENFCNRQLQKDSLSPQMELDFHGQSLQGDDVVNTLQDTDFIDTLKHVNFVAICSDDHTAKEKTW